VINSKPYHKEKWESFAISENLMNSKKRQQQCFLSDVRAACIYARLAG